MADPGQRWRPGCNPSARPLARVQPLASLECSILGGLQGVVDDARLIVHEIGARAYRVWLVWSERDSVTGKWAEVDRLELLPVRVEEGREGFTTEAAGQVPGGTIDLREVSPLQVDEHTLRGWRGGQPWGADNPRREFFFELQQIPRCTSSPQPERYRYVLDGVPEFLPTSHEWSVRLLAAFGRRTPAGNDTTVPGEFAEPPDAEIL